MQPPSHKSRIATVPKRKDIDDQTLIKRSRVFVVFQILGNLAFLIASPLFITDQNLLFASRIVCIPLILYLISMMLINNSQILRWFFFGDMLVSALIVMGADLLVGSSSGSLWTMGIIWPVVTFLVLRDLRFFLLLSVIDLIALITIPLLELLGVIPMTFLVPIQQVWQLWVINLFLFTTATTMMFFVGRDERRSVNETQAMIRSTMNTEAQLKIAYQQAQASSHELQTAVVRKEMLQAQAQALQAPLITINEHVALLPLTGQLDPQRMARLRQALPTQLHTLRTTHVIIDITGAHVTDSQIVSELSSLIEVLLLLGTQPIITGVSGTLAAMIADHPQGHEMVKMIGRLDSILAHQLSETTVESGGQAWI